MAEVAAAAGVSVMSVSYAYGRPDRVSEATRGKVLDAAHPRLQRPAPRRAVTAKRPNQQPRRRPHRETVVRVRRSPGPPLPLRNRRRVPRHRHRPRPAPQLTVDADVDRIATPLSTGSSSGRRWPTTRSSTSSSPPASRSASRAAHGTPAPRSSESTTSRPRGDRASGPDRSPSDPWCRPSSRTRSRGVGSVARSCGRRVSGDPERAPRIPGAVVAAGLAGRTCRSRSARHYPRRGCATVHGERPSPACRRDRAMSDELALGALDVVREGGIDVPGDVGIADGTTPTTPRARPDHRRAVAVRPGAQCRARRARAEIPSARPQWRVVERTSTR